MPNTPTSICLEDAVLRALPDGRVERFLEIGTGSGNLTTRLGKMGYKGIGIDLSQEAVRMTRDLLDRYAITGIEVLNKDFFAIDDSFGLVISLEVMEHIEDDVRAFRKIRDLMDEGGLFIFTVPAHKKAWGATDELAGHVRRYEREELEAKLIEAGLEVKKIGCLAFPVGNIMKIGRDFLNKKTLKKRKTEEDVLQRTVESGVIKALNAPDLIYNTFFNRVTLYPAVLASRLFQNTDLGQSYIISAIKAR